MFVKWRLFVKSSCGCLVVFCLLASFLFFVCEVKCSFVICLSVLLWSEGYLWSTVLCVWLFVTWRLVVWLFVKWRLFACVFAPLLACLFVCVCCRLFCLFVCEVKVVCALKWRLLFVCLWSAVFVCLFVWLFAKCSCVSLWSAVFVFVCLLLS